MAGEADPEPLEELDAVFEDIFLHKGSLLEIEIELLEDLRNPNEGVRRG